MNLQEAKEILERYNDCIKTNYAGFLEPKQELIQALDIAIQCLEDSITPKLEKCYNCYEMVKMVSTGEICPKCKC